MDVGARAPVPGPSRAARAPDGNLGGAGPEKGRRAPVGGHADDRPGARAVQGARGRLLSLRRQGARLDAGPFVYTTPRVGARERGSYCGIPRGPSDRARACGVSGGATLSAEGLRAPEGRRDTPL